MTARAGHGDRHESAGYHVDTVIDHQVSLVAEAFADGQQVKWYRDKATGKNMDRPGWKRLEADIDAGKVSTVVVWRLDRLGRSASGLTLLFEKLTDRKIGLVSLKRRARFEDAGGQTDCERVGVRRIV